MNIMYIIIIYICLILLIIGISVLIFIFINYMKHLNGLEEINNDVTDVIKSLQKRENDISIDSIQRLEFTNDLLEFIDKLIDVELLNNKRFDIILDEVNSTRKPSIDVNESLTDISTTVFEAIKPDIFVTPYSVLTEDYLMKYIQKRTFIKYMVYLNESVSSKL